MRPAYPPQLRSLLVAGERAAMIVHESGIVLFANPQATLLFRYSPGELEGSSVELLLPKRFRTAHIDQRLRFTDEFRSRPMGNGQRLIACCKDGVERAVQISLSPVQHGLDTLVVAVIVEAH